MWQKNQQLQKQENPKSSGCDIGHGADYVEGPGPFLGNLDCAGCVLESYH